MPLLNFPDRGDFVQPHAQDHVAYFTLIALTFWALLLLDNTANDGMAPAVAEEKLSLLSGNS
jgi:hypothetical protein